MLDIKQRELDLEEIFSDRFSVICNLASGNDRFRVYTKTEDAVIRHFQRKDNDTLIYTFNYLGRKINEPYDKNYEHPYDVGIATLIMYFHEHSKFLFKLSSLYIAKHWKHLGWARSTYFNLNQEMSLKNAND